MTPLLTVADAAEILRCSESVVRHLVKTRQIAVVRIETGRAREGSKSSRILIRPQDLEEYIEGATTRARLR